MIEVSGTGRTGRTPPAPAAGRSPRTGSGFGAALDATRKEAKAQPKAAPRVTAGNGRLSPEGLKESGQLTDLDKLRLETGRFQGAAGTMADRCLAALDALEAGDDSGDAREYLRQAYGELVRATEDGYGRLPHDSLARILAMAEYAQKGEVF